MKKKQWIALLMGAALCLSMAVPTTALAAKGDAGGSEQGGGREDGSGGHGGGKGDSEVSYSATEITIPDGIADGNYEGKATVSPDANVEFEAYDIAVTVTMKDGSPIAFSVSGADGGNAKYSGQAQTGISGQINALTAGTYAVDSVSGATCSSHAIVQGLNAALKEGEAMSGTWYEMENTVAYQAFGSSCLVTVHNPEKDTEYHLSLAYGVGKFSDDLEPVESYCSVEKAEETQDSIVYRVTMKPDVYYEIQDDDLIHKLYVNNPGTSLSIKVNDRNIGNFQIVSEAVLSINENRLSLTGGNGDTLAGYIGLIDEVTVRYVDENGETISRTYSAAWQHDMEAAFLGSDLFNEDGSINFDLRANVTLTGEDFEALKDENGNNITEEVAVFPNGAEGDYQITVSAGEGYPDVTAEIGKSHASKAADSESNEEANTVEEPSQEQAAAETAAKQEPEKQKETSAAYKTGDVPKTGDREDNPYALLIVGVSALALLLTAQRKQLYR